MKFIAGHRYCSDDKHEMLVVNRFDRTKQISVEVGFRFPVDYKIYANHEGCEYIIVEKRIFRASN